MQINEGSLTISAAYGAKVPGAADFSSQEARLSFELEFPVTGEYDAIVDKAQALEAALMTNLKLGVFSQLGLGVDQQADGSVQPDFGTLPARAAAAERRGTTQANSGNAGNQRPQRGPTKAQQAGVEIPSYTVTVDGREVVVKDRRDLKGSVYADNAADFLVDGESVWILKRDNSVNPYGQKIAEAIAPYVPFGESAALPTPL